MASAAIIKPAGLLVVALLLGAGMALPLPPGPAPAEAPADLPAAANPEIPPLFEANIGQHPEDVALTGRLAGGYAVFRQGAVDFHIVPPGGPASDEDLVTYQRRTWTFQDARAVEPVGENVLASRSSYMVGSDPAGWVRDVPHFERISYNDLYPGIDLEFYFVDGALKYDFIVAPHAAPDQIRILTGLPPIPTPEGGLHHGTFVQEQAYCYQASQVDCSYRVGGNGFGFRVGDYDPSEALVIDPLVNWASFVGGSGTDRIIRSALLSNGNLLLAGTTASPSILGNPNTAAGFGDGFLAELNPSGTALVALTYFGGSGSDEVADLELTAAGQIVVAGTTRSRDFPVTAESARLDPRATARHQAAQMTDIVSISAIADADRFVARFSAAYVLGIAVVFGGTGVDTTGGIAVPAAGGRVIVAGSTEAKDHPLTHDALQLTDAGRDAGVVAVLSPTYDSFEYATLVGGLGSDRLTDVQSDGVSIYVVGQTTSDDIPTITPVQPTRHGGSDLYVARFQRAPTCLNGTCTTQPPPGWKLVRATYFGGSGNEENPQLRLRVLPTAHEAWVAATTTSSDYPLAGTPWQSARSGPSDMVVTKFLGGPSGPAFSSYYGSPGADSAAGIVGTSAGDVYVVGNVGAGFPILTSACTVSNSVGGAGLLHVSAAAVRQLSVVVPGLQAAHATPLSGSQTVLAGSAGSTFATTAGSLQPGFAGGAADGALALVADNCGAPPPPPVRALLWGTYLGGANEDTAVGTCFADGLLHVGGWTTSLDFPQAPISNTINYPTGARRGILAEFTPQGHFHYATYIGSPTAAWSPTEVACGEDHCIGLGGHTTSPGLPALGFQAAPAGDVDMYLYLHCDDSGVETGTYLGGTGFDAIDGLAINEDEVWVTGVSSSNDFPLANHFDATASPTPGFGDVAIAVLSRDLRTLHMSTHVGDYGRGRSVTTPSPGLGYIAGMDYSGPTLNSPAATSGSWLIVVSNLQVSKIGLVCPNGNPGFETLAVVDARLETDPTVVHLLADDSRYCRFRWTTDTVLDSFASAAVPSVPYGAHVIAVGRYVFIAGQRSSAFLPSSCTTYAYLCANSGNDGIGHQVYDLQTGTTAYYGTVNGDGAYATLAVDHNTLEEYIVSRDSRTHQVPPFTTPGAYQELPGGGYDWLIRKFEAVV